jgi:hypothetical protein
MIMKREYIGSLIAVLAAAAILVSFWIAYGTFPLPALFAGIFGPVFAVLFARWMRKYQDERFAHIYNLASRNALVFLIFALPYLGAILAIQSIALEAVGLLLLVWALSLAIFYVSTYVYYKR